MPDKPLLEVAYGPIYDERSRTIVLEMLEREEQAHLKMVPILRKEGFDDDAIDFSIKAREYRDAIEHLKSLTLPHK